jgi:DNA-binding response OmpR family regulator
LLAQRGREGGEERASEPADIDDAGTMVLIAERDPFAADFLDYFLRTEGYDVRVVFGADDVVRSFAEHPPKVLVVDLLISGGVGLELCRSVRDRSAVPILAMSVLDSRDESLDAGVDAFLRKPLDRPQFVSTVRDLLGTSAYLRTGTRV